ncbi:CBO0543 family protein [Alkalihalobacterium alkalinitrilicum]|uniref:CBO0543 family protein n=1 Tax=Alkalihalobacterium alkalinitrilicum TaxID=427920 RepID=UPI003B75BD15
MALWFTCCRKKLISYPSRLFFKKANRASFTFEYFVYPGLCSLFNLYYPEKRNDFVKLLYYCFYTSIITFFEIFAVKYTKVIKYKKIRTTHIRMSNMCSPFIFL